MNDRFFVRVSAASEEALAALQKYGFDLFRHTVKSTADKRFTIDGLLTTEQAAQLVKDGYVVEMRENAAADAYGAPPTVELAEWLAERGF